MSGQVEGMGRIIQWPDGYAMTLGYRHSNAVRCCSGHETPEAAKQHGIVRAIEVIQARADVDISEWAGMQCHDDGEGLCHHGTCDECGGAA